MNSIAAFEKVSFEEFCRALPDAEFCRLDCYKSLKTPRRATAGSAGYDFFAPYSFEIKPGESVTIPTGFRVKMEMGWVLCIFPRSGLGFKYRCQLNNTVGVIDSDYYFADNEGHIFIKLFNDSRENKLISLKTGEAFAQGVFLPFGLAEEDEVTDKRTGGLGSTSKANG